MGQSGARPMGYFGALLQRLPFSAASRGVDENRPYIPDQGTPEPGGSRGVLQHLQPRVSKQSDRHCSTGYAELYHHHPDRGSGKQRYGCNRLIHLPGWLLVAFGLRGHQLYFAADPAKKRPISSEVYVLISLMWGGRDLRACPP